MTFSGDILVIAKTPPPPPTTHSERLQTPNQKLARIWPKIIRTNDNNKYFVVLNVHVKH